MKRLFLLPLLMLTSQLPAQTLFTYGNHKVAPGEFLNAYRKNRLPTDTGKDAMANYLQLYINYKLKVQDAKDIQLDTLPSLKADLQSFRRQIEQNYIYDQQEYKRLVDEAAGRSQKDIRVAALVVAPAMQLDKQTLKARADEVFEAVQKDHKVDLSALESKGVKVAKEDLGFITAFTLPYEIENIVYGLAPGAYSRPYLLNDNYIIFKNEGERPAAGKIKVAQILLATPPGGDTSWHEGALLADSIFHVLQNGVDFAALAKTFSDDRKTFFNGGEMPEFGVGKFAPAFEDHAFALEYPGEISKPFKTVFGYHILKLISANPVSSIKTGDLEALVKQEVLTDSRIELAKNKLIELAKNRTGFHRTGLANADLYKVTDSSLIAGKEITSGRVNTSSVLFRFNDGLKVTVGEWIQFAKNSGKVVDIRRQSSYNTLMPEFESQSILKNYQNRLEEFDKGFVRQLHEFAEGNMLFEMTQRQVWGKASEDSTGLRKYFDVHRGKYQWGESADAIIFSCNNEETAKQAINELKANTWRQILDRNPFNIQADSGRFEIAQLPVKQAITKTGVTPPVTDKFDHTATFVQIIKVFPKGTPRDFADARGLVIEDYQKVLEDAWIKKLRTKYPVKVNQKVFDALPK